MRETNGDLADLPGLLDVSFAGSGEHLRAAFDQERRLSAKELVALLPGLFEMHLAAVTAAGAPLVAPVDGFLLRGKICLGLPALSVRGRLVHQDPRVSVSFNTDDVAFIAHGRFVDRCSEERPAQVGGMPAVPGTLGCVRTPACHLRSMLRRSAGYTMAYRNGLIRAM